VTAPSARVVAVTRVSTSEQADSGAGLAVQRATIEAAALARGWEIVAMLEDAGVSGGTLERPGLKAAIAMIECGEADTLVVAKLDRLSRSMLDFSTLMERARKRGWSIVALDVGVDTGTPAGEMLASVLASFAQYERRLISQRTKDALAVKRAEGVKIGRPRALSDDIVARVVALRAQGLSYERVARQLNDAGVPTAHGGARWYGATIKGVMSYASESLAPIGGEA
jgi:DNA invertase Pin-like site-specific DNA recombinase